MASKEGATKVANLSDRKMYRIDIPANRYDMLCVEGIARAIRTFLGISPQPKYSVVQPAKLQQIFVKAETAAIRPFIVAAILRDVSFDQMSYDSFIELQDKLHNNICRKRTLVAIGTHDMDSINGPFTYEARLPADIAFVPLNQQKEVKGKDFVQFYEADRKLSKFLHIIRDKPRFPLVVDSNNNVLSLPPIINSEHSKIKLTTRNVFVECTATDLTKANVVLNTVITMFSQYCAKPFTAEAVEVVYADGKKHVYPDLSLRKVEAKVKYVNSSIGIDCEPDELVKLVSKMSLSAQVTADKSTLVVQVPPTRSDILHACDVMEDVAIAYNINKVVKTHPKSNTIAVPLPINKLSDMIRKEIAFSGFTEVLAFTLCSLDENFSFLNRKDDGTAVKLANPKTIEYQVVRTSLLPGILKTIAANRHAPLPLKVFEISDIVLRDESQERRARNQRQLCAIVCGKKSGFEVIHGLVDRLMQLVSVKRASPTSSGTNGFYIQESQNETFFQGRRADVIYKDKVIGSFGIVHPTVLEKFEIQYPCSALEIDIEPFL